jgi:competence protein ComEC
MKNCLATVICRGLRVVASAALVMLALGHAPSAWAQSECVGPSEAVVRAVMFRAEPNTRSAILGRFLPDEQAPVIAEVSGWYQVRMATGEAAFVSKRWTRLVACQIPITAGAPPPAFEIHVIDVGTGLSVFVRGQDFALLFDAGSNDDLAKGSKNRVLAYLRHAAPQLTRIDHVLLSHPHQDHVQLFADVFEAYDIGQAWNSGAYNEICSYRLFLEAIASEANLIYHSATFDHEDEVVELPARCQQPASELVLHHGPRIGTDPIVLGEQAAMVFLHADGETHPDLNDNSLVVRLDLGGQHVLLVGDAGGGSRQDPSASPSDDSIEGQLLACCASQLRADVLVVGHHGSKTSSRTAFLDAIQASDYLVSSGPKKYSGTMLPDREVIDELARRGKVWRTDLNDDTCATATDKIGEQDDGRPGGCNNIVVHLEAGTIQAHYDPHP